MSKRKKELEISILTIDILSYIGLIIGICGCIVFAIKLSELNAIFSILLITLSLIVIAFSACFIVSSIWSKTEYKKELNVKKVPRDVYERTFTATADEEILKIVLVTAIGTIILLATIIIAFVL